MDPDFEIKLDPEEPAARPAVSPGFLEAFGLEAPESDPVESFSLDADEETVVLSSLPEDLDFPKVVAEPTRGLALSISVTRGTPAAISPTPETEIPALDLEVEDSVVDVLSAPDEVAAEEQISEPTQSDFAAVADQLNLECPGCGGGLVLRREHLGIEGLCVWCHTPIVAAESARDGQVRVYPIFGGGPEGPKKTNVSEPVSEAVAPEAPAPVPAPTMEAVVEEKIDPVTAPAAEIASPVIETPTPAPLVEEPAPPVGPLDLESLYAVGGFVEPEEKSEPDAQEISADKPTTIGFVTPKAASAPAPAPEVVSVPSQENEEPPLGFGNFLKTPPTVTEPAPSPVAEFAGPTPWGPPVLPVETPAEPRSSVQSASSGFTGFAPVAKPEDESPSPFAGAVPSVIPPAFAEPISSQDNSEAPRSISDFDMPAAAVNRAFSVGSSEDDAPSSISFPGPSTSGFSAGFAAPAPVETSGGGLFDSPAPAPSIPWDVNPEVSDAQPTGFLDLPAPQSPEPPEPEKTAEDALFSHFAPSETPAGESLFQTEPDREPADEPTAVTTEAPAIHPIPIVTSQPLGTHSKPKVRKGFIVLMVVLLGFACGAALASYVLPVDQYVKQAREFMEQKFGAVPMAVAPQANAPAQP